MREVLAESLTIRGGVDVAQNVLSETQTALIPLEPYLDTLRWVFIAVAFGGIAAARWAKAVLHYGAIALAIVPFLLSVRRSGQCVGRIAERLETTENTNEIQRQIVEAAARLPRDRNELVDRLRDGGF